MSCLWHGTHCNVCSWPTSMLQLSWQKISATVSFSCIENQRELFILMQNNSAHLRESSYPITIQAKVCFTLYPWLSKYTTAGSSLVRPTFLAVNFYIAYSWVLSINVAIFQSSTEKMLMALRDLLYFKRQPEILRFFLWSRNKLWGSVWVERGRWEEHCTMGN